MSKRVTMRCPEHTDCTLHLTVANGADKMEHVPDTPTPQARQMADRLDRLEPLIGDVDGLRARVDALDKALRADIDRVANSIVVPESDPRIGSALKMASAADRGQVAMEAKFRALDDTVRTQAQATKKTLDELTARLNQLAPAVDRLHGTVSSLEARFSQEHAESSRRFSDIEKRMT